MNYFKQLFGKKNTVECPRCLGKGHVDENDIKRLGNELKWLPGKCAYCNGTGTVDPGLLSRIPVNAAYIANNLLNAEKKRIVNGNPAALERMHLFDENIDRLTGEIKYLYLNQKLNAERIAEVILASPSTNVTEDHIKNKRDLIEFVEFVIARIDKQA